jgi:ubiquinone/menaquinone biosynthesis C-methylase UbiE
MTNIVYDKIGSNYNKTRCADPYLTKRLSSLLSLKQSLHYLDVGCGTGNYTIALANCGCNFYGIEPSKIMLAKATEINTNVSWALGVAEYLPLQDDFFNGCIAVLTIHLWKNLEKGFYEIFRVLKNQSKFVIFTSLPEQREKYWLNFYFPNMLKTTSILMPNFTKIEKSLKRAGFIISEVEKYFVEKNLEDLFLYSGKLNPTLYLNSEIRKGILSFAAFADQNEVEKGVQQLAKDIETNKISEIIQDYKNDLGDYIFIVASK